MRTVKLRAVRENRKVEDMTAELPKRGPAQEPGAPGVVRNRVQFPLVQGGHPAAPAEDVTPERVAQVLIDDDARWTSET